MNSEKADILIKAAHDKLGMIVFPEDRLIIFELTPQADYEEHREDYVRELALLLMLHGYTDIPEDRTQMDREEIARKLLQDTSRMFHHLMNEDEIRSTQMISPFPKIKYQVQAGHQAYIMLGNLRGYNEGDITEHTVLDGDHFLWGIVYG